MRSPSCYGSNGVRIDLALGQLQLQLTSNEILVQKHCVLLGHKSSECWMPEALPEPVSGSDLARTSTWTLARDDCTLLE